MELVMKLLFEFLMELVRTKEPEAGGKSLKNIYTSTRLFLFICGNIMVQTVWTADIRHKAHSAGLRVEEKYGGSLWRTKKRWLYPLS